MASPYLKAALITVAIAALGFFFISQLDYMRADELRADIDRLLFQAQSERLMHSYFQTMENSTSEYCKYIYGVGQEKTSRIYELADKIRYYEKSNLVNSNYRRIRDQYYLSNAELYLNARAAAKYCGSSPYATVLFFYKVKEDCPPCRAQGELLDSVVARNPNVRVFAFPIDTGYEFIDVFARRHGITEVPAVVINDKTVLRGLRDEAEIERYLDDSAGASG
ncbi:MAG: thioredoxin family protein [Candidatus Micrarchaeota archaeon]|nr:thioredoxin family protein [Candidatus Micrarchaeota archaeon]